MTLEQKDVENTGNTYDTYKKDFRTALPQFLAVSVKNLLLFGYGMTLGFPTILIPAVSNPIGGEVLTLKKSEISWISSVNLIVVPLGCALSGIVTSPLGRRRAMQMVNIPFFIAWLIFHFSTTTGHLYGALFLTGLAGGLLEAPVLTYVAEITQPHLRGPLTATSSMGIIIGVFTQFLFGLFLYWRVIALVNIIFTILAVIALCFIPESPYWLVSKKRHDEARKSLQWLRGWTTAHAVEQELKDIQALFKKRTVELEEMLEAPMDKYYATVILGVLQIIGSGLCVLLVHYVGKRPLTFFSTAGAGICCILVACYEGYIRTYGIPHTEKSAIIANATLSATNLTSDDIANGMKNPYSWIPTTLLMIIALITHTGIRLLPWILIGEVFSAKTRSGGAGLASAVGYLFGFLSNKMFINMVDTLSIWGTYGFYGIVCLSGCIVFYFLLPETEGKKLGDIQDHFAGIKRLSNEVYRSKKKLQQDVSRMHELKGKNNPSFELDHSSP